MSDDDTQYGAPYVARESDRPRQLAAATGNNGHGPNGHADDEDERTVLARAANELTELGMVVFGVKPREKAPPLVDAWQEIATADEVRVRAAWTKEPRANIALQCGVRSGVVVVDIDGPTGRTSLAALEAVHGPLPITVAARSGREDGGHHFYFAHPGFPVQNTLSQLGKKIDIKADGGYVLAPPSVHPSGAKYAWVLGRKLGEIPLAPLPAWLVAWILEYQAAPSTSPRSSNADASSYDPVHLAKWLTTAIDDECAKVMRLAAGDGRNNQLNEAGFALAGYIWLGLDETLLRAELTRTGYRAGLTPLEIKKTVESAISKGKLKPRSGPQPREQQQPPIAANDNTAAAEPTASEPAKAKGEPLIELVGTPEIFAPLEPMRWVSRALMIGPGRPTLIAAYGSSAKTLASQSMLLSLAAGQQVWGHFEAGDPVRVVHLDYEQGKRDTYSRYQRLALGHGIDSSDLGERIRVGTMPSVYLTSDEAYDAFARLSEDSDLVLIDSLRASAPGVDENASEVRSYLDLLTRISEATGAAFVLLHHAGKPKDGHGSDARTLARGSSAIFDACGCVLNIVAGKTGADPRRVSMTKPPTSSEGAPIDPFDLVVEDVAIGDAKTAGVRVRWQFLERQDPNRVADAKYQADAERVLLAVRANPGASQSTVAMRAGLNKQRAFDVLSSLVDEGRVAIVAGPRRLKTCWIVEGAS